jgi:HD-GYP domain-containing protein (c-di-GMP phosphodiesterase class II)
MSPAAAFKIIMSSQGFHLDSDLLKAFVLCIGFYPVGSLVELSNNLLGLVWESNEEDMKKPIVKTFYNTNCIK